LASEWRPEHGRRQEGHRGAGFAVKPVLRLQPHERDAERIVAHGVGDVGADALRQQEIVEPDLQSPQHVRRGDVGDRAVAQHAEIRLHPHEFARVDIDPDAEHALFAPRALRFARAGHRDHYVVRRTQCGPRLVGLDGAEQHQILTGEARSDRHPVIRQRHHQPLGTCGPGAAGQENKCEDERQPPHHPLLTWRSENRSSGCTTSS
jgi:hypothetical protein